MKPRITLVLVAILALAITGTSTAATRHHAPQSKQKQTYLHLYKKVQKEHGKRAPGRNIVRYGLKGGKPATSRHIARSIVTLENILHPAPAPAPVVAASTSSPTTSYAPTQVQSSGGGGAGGLAACIRSHEGGYTQSDPTGTYHGAYQFDDQTWHAATGLSGHASDYPPSVQDHAFQTWHPGHPGAWPVSGPACGA